MKTLLFGFGIYFAWWNFDSLRDNPLAVWHYIAFSFSSVVVGLWILCRIFAWIVQPPVPAPPDEAD